MHVDDGAVETDRLDLDAGEPLMLRFLEQATQHGSLRPAVHAGVDRVLVAEALWQAAPLAALLRDVEDRIDDSCRLLSETLPR